MSTVNTEAVLPDAVSNLENRLVDIGTVYRAAKLIRNSMAVPNHCRLDPLPHPTPPNPTLGLCAHLMITGVVWSLAQLRFL